MNQQRQTPINSALLEAICKILGHTNEGLSGKEIGNFLAQIQVVDIHPNITKWERLYNALGQNQNKHQTSNNILAFISKSMNPARFIGKKDTFDDMRFNLNKVLSFMGLQLSESGKYLKTEISTTIQQAEQKVSRFKHKLEQRNVHEKIYEYCKAELLAENYFHSVFEAVKSIAETIREKSGLNLDGGILIDTAFSLNSPLIKINDLSTETKQNEHKGFANLIKGVFGMFRNTTAHSPKIIWEINENDALDIMSTISLIHRRLENKNCL